MGLTNGLQRVVITRDTVMVPPVVKHCQQSDGLGREKSLKFSQKGPLPASHSRKMFMSTRIAKLELIVIVDDTVAGGVFCEIEKQY